MICFKESCVRNPSLSVPTLPSRTQLFLDSVSFLSRQGGEFAVKPRLRFCNRSRWHQSTYPTNLLCCSCSPSLCSIHTLIRLSFLPSAWKSANITALPTKGAKTDPYNYRPISLLPIISKVMESINASDIKSFLFSNALISNHQFGLKPGHSTLDMLLLLSQQWRHSMPDMKSEPYP